MKIKCFTQVTIQIYVVSIGKNKHMAESMDENLNEEDNPQYQKEIKAINEESSRYKLSI